MAQHTALAQSFYRAAAKGGIATFRRVAGGASEASRTDVQARAVKQNSKLDGFELRKLVPNNPLTLHVAGHGLTFVPAEGQVFSWPLNGPDYTVLFVEKHAPDGETVIYWEVVANT